MSFVEYAVFLRRAGTVWMRADCCSSALAIEPTGGRDDYLTGLGVGTEDVHGPSSGGASTSPSLPVVARSLEVDFPSVSAVRRNNTENYRTRLCTNEYIE